VVAISTRHKGRHCRFVGPDGRLGEQRSCRRPVFLLAHGRAHWRFALRLRHLPRARFRVAVHAVDVAGNRERVRKHTRLRLPARRRT